MAYDDPPDSPIEVWAKPPVSSHPRNASAYTSPDTKLLQLDLSSDKYADHSKHWKIEYRLW